MLNDWNDETYMRQMVRMDIDLPAIPRWLHTAMFFPDVARLLVNKYGPASKKERKDLLETIKKNRIDPFP